MFCYSAPDYEAEYCDERVCVCLSARDHIFGTARLIFTNFFAHVPYGRGSVLLWRRSDTLCTSGLWMTSYLFIIQGCSTSPQHWAWLLAVRSNTSCRPTDARDYFSGT